MLNDENDATASIAIKTFIKWDTVARLAMKSQKMAKMIVKINTFSLPLGRIGYKLTSKTLGNKQSGLILNYPIMEITIPFARLKEYQRKNGYDVKRTENLKVDIFI